MAETPFLNFFGGEFDPESGRFRDKQGRFVPAPPKTSEPSPTDAEADMKNKQAAEDVQDIKQNTEDAAGKGNYKDAPTFQHRVKGK